MYRGFRFRDRVMIVERSPKRRMRCDLGIAHAQIRIGGIVAHAVFARAALH